MLLLSCGYIIRRLTKMPRYFTQKINKEELVEKIEETLKSTIRNPESVSDNYDPYETQEYLETILQGEKPLSQIIEQGYINQWRLNKQLDKDLKVYFDYDNTRASPNEAYGNGMEELVGFHTLENGLTFLGLQDSGDSDCLLFFMVYHDGSQLRAYIPKEGNLWNTDTKEALGRNPESDVQNLLKRKLIDRQVAEMLIEDFCSETVYDHVDFDTGKIKEDITRRITYKGD